MVHKTLQVDDLSAANWFHERETKATAKLLKILQIVSRNEYFKYIFN